MAAAVVPQLELLPLCDAFITHGGMGSVMEVRHRPLVTEYGRPMPMVIATACSPWSNGHRMLTRP